jgi:hypothetical protein
MEAVAYAYGEVHFVKIIEVFEVTRLKYGEG